MARYTEKQVNHLLACVNAKYLKLHPEYDNEFHPDGPYHLAQAYGGNDVVASWSGSACSDIMGYYGTMREAYMFAHGLYHGYFDK